VKTEFLVGTSGWSYKDWKGVFYPDGIPTTSWIEFYAKTFNTVELNMSFYRTPADKTINGWLKKIPNGFRFCLKAYRGITHYSRLADKGMVERHHELVGKFGRAAVCTLFQFPPSFAFNDDNLSRIDTLLSLFKKEHDYTIEFRHKEWWNEKTYRLLEGRAAFCTVSGLGMPADLKVTSKVIYIRFHGGRYNTLYKDSELNEWSKKIVNAVRMNKGIKRVYAYFNNDYKGYAVKNAITLKELLINA
jgi:uncharacterized protein YecE (DUF72 family)